MPVTAATGKWAVDLCACCVAMPYCVLPFCTTCAPCVPLARAADRAGVLSYRRVFILSGTLVVALMIWPGSREEMVVVTPNDGGEPAYGVLVRGPDYWPIQVGFYVLVGALFALTLVVRRRLVAKYAITEHPLLSCVLLSFCPQCAIGQQAMHVDLVEVGAVQVDCSCSEAHPLMDRQTNRDVEML
jgi:Cys-rich protein (TIGR01571 family)